MKIINTTNAPAAIGPYSQGIVLENNLFYLSGQLGIDLVTNDLGNSLEAQTKLALENINQILLAAGYQKTDVIKTTILLTDINDFGQVNEIYGSFFAEHKPARSTFAVSALPKNALIEIEAIAFK